VNFDIMSLRLPEEDEDGRWRTADHNGNLLAFYPSEVRRGVKTAHGEADAVFCSKIVNVDTGRVYRSALVYGAALVPNVGGGAPDNIVLGRLGQGEKRGENRAWVLFPHNEQELQRFLDWQRAHEISEVNA